MFDWSFDRLKILINVLRVSLTKNGRKRVFLSTLFKFVKRNELETVNQNSVNSKRELYENWSPMTVFFNSSFAVYRNFKSLIKERASTFVDFSIISLSNRSNLQHLKQLSGFLAEI